VSPFSRYLKTLRIHRGIRQKDLAYQLGYEPSYLSALERSEKGPPKEDFVHRLISGLCLDDEEQAELLRTLKLSRRQISLPPQASEDEYRLIHEIEPQLGHLSPLQIQLIKLALRLPPSLGAAEVGFGPGSWCLQPEGKEAPKM